MAKRTGALDRRKILDEVFDERTLKGLHKLMNDGTLYTLDFPLATGKEASVFHGSGKKGEEYAVKIYRVGNATFNSIRKYISEDPRFRGIPHDRLGVIFAWAKKEFKNLLRMREAGAHVPEPLKSHENILVMEYLFVGENHDPAPMLKFTKPEDPEAVFDALAKDVRKVVKKGRLVHGDLSEYNVLMVGQEPFMIDVGQGVVLDHPHAPDYLRRDAHNLCRFFGRLGVECDKDEVYAGWTKGVSFRR